MASQTRSEQEARYVIFDTFVVNDARQYYRTVLEEARRAASQVNRLRAAFGFLGGLGAAVIGLIVQSTPAIVCPASGDNVFCTASPIVALLTASVIIFPMLSIFLSLLPLIFEWDERIQVYETALENLEVADAVSPIAEMKDIEYSAAVRAFTQGTLDVMHDEAVIYGDSAFSPENIDQER